MNTDTAEKAYWTALRYIGRGLLQGIGFCVALGFVYLIASHAKYHPAEHQSRVDATLGDESHAGEIGLSAVSEEKLGGATAILGIATNHGAAVLHSVHIQANLFNHEKFVDQYSTYLTGSLGPGKSQYFKNCLRMQGLAASRARQLQTRSDHRLLSDPGISPSNRPFSRSLPVAVA